MATQTETYKLYKPARTDRVNIEDLNKNFDIIEEELKKRPLSSDTAGVTFFNLDVSAWVAVDFESEEPVTVDLTDHVNSSLLVAQISAGHLLRLRINTADAKPMFVIFEATRQYTTDELGAVTDCYGIAPNADKNSCFNFELRAAGKDEEYTVSFAAYPPGATGGMVKTVNGVEPDENGNVEVPTAEGTVKFVNGIAPDETGNAVLLSTTGLSIDWANGTYTETLSDGTSRTEDIEFNANGIPTKFGSMAFSISGV